MAAFAGFPTDGVRFLADLKANNNRDWFAENKSTYERSLKQPAEAFSAATAASLEAAMGVAVRSKIFRIHRDVRFSKDKTPYNTHLHIAFLPTDGCGLSPAWFFGFEPGQVTVGTGVFALDKQHLAAYREAVASQAGDALTSAIDRLRAAGVRFNEPDLKRTPAGYAEDHPRADLLKRKALHGWIDFDNPHIVTRPGVLDDMVEGYLLLRPLYDWLRSCDRD